MSGSFETENFIIMALGKVKRKDLFIATKLPMMAMRPEDVEPFFEMSRKDLGLDYVDLYLIHSPLGVHKDSTNGLKFFGGKVTNKVLFSCTVYNDYYNTYVKFFVH